MDQSLLLSLGEAEPHHWWYAVRRGIVLDALDGLDVVHGTPRDVVEVGCGTGGFLEALRHRYPSARVTGVEPSDAAREIAVAAGRDVVAGSFDPLPLPDDSVDLLVALDVLEHCSDDAAALAEARRVLRPGGRLLMTVPALPSLWSGHDDRNEHRCRYVREQLVEVVGGAGFSMHRCSYFNLFLLPVAYLVRALPRVLGGRGVGGAEVPSAPVNAALRGVFGAERPLLRRLDLPLGVSLIITAGSPD